MTTLLCLVIVCASALAGLVLVLRHRERLAGNRDELLKAVQEEQKKTNQRVSALEAVRLGLGR
jgi:hypothetical protein